MQNWVQGFAAIDVKMILKIYYKRLLNHNQYVNNVIQLSSLFLFCCFLYVNVFVFFSFCQLLEWIFCGLLLKTILVDHLSYAFSFLSSFLHAVRFVICNGTVVLKCSLTCLVHLLSRLILLIQSIRMPNVIARSRCGLYGMRDVGDRQRAEVMMTHCDDCSMFWEICESRRSAGWCVGQLADKCSPDGRLSVLSARSGDVACNLWSLSGGWWSFRPRVQPPLPLMADTLLSYNELLRRLRLVDQCQRRWLLPAWLPIDTSATLTPS